MGNQQPGVAVEIDSRHSETGSCFYQRYCLINEYIAFARQGLLGGAQTRISSPDLLPNGHHLLSLLQLFAAHTVTLRELKMYGRQQQQQRLHAASDAEHWTRLLRDDDGGIENRHPNAAVSTASSARNLTSRRVTAFPSPDAFTALMRAQQQDPSSCSSSSSLSASSSSHSGRKRRAPIAAGGQQKQQRCSASDQRQQQQLFLDLGQPLLGLTVCPECGCGYNRGQPEDERQHRRQHDNRTLGIAFAGWKEEPVVVVDGRLRSLSPLPGGHRLLCIRASHLKRHPSHAEKVKEVLQQQCEQLGTAADVSLRLLTGVDSDSGCTAALLLYVAERRVVGSLLVKSPVSASRLLQSADGSWLLSSAASDAVSAAVGVEAVWVLPRCRRQGLATRMLDACRLCLLYGVSISKQDMAFSQPTEDGRRLAQRYADRCDVLAYRD